MSLFIPFLLLAISSVTDHYTPAFSKCLATGPAAQGQTVAQVRCTMDELARQDRRLNAAYRIAMGRRTKARQDDLRRDERAWIAHRDATCRTAYHQEGGTIDQVLGASCELGQTTQRRLYLERLDR